MRFLTSRSTLVALVLPFIPAVLGSPYKRSGSYLALDTDFPDPGFIGTLDGKWYAFGTQGNGKRVQIAESNDFTTWSLLDTEGLPTVGAWEEDALHYAPDVIQRGDGKYVMYYCANSKQVGPNKDDHHCVGTALADHPAGPYVPNDKALVCDLDKGGAIDAAGFRDKDGTNYVLYKVNGNSIGHGGDCNNGVDPLVPTPIMLQKLADDAVTPVGDPVQVLDRNTADGDGPLVEAPSLVLADDTYYLFYSTHCYNEKTYDTRYATASSITGPYTKNNEGFLKTGDSPNLIAPGGATVCGCGDRMLFHGWCDKSMKQRCMYGASVSLKGGKAAIV
ncbi:hypothetical protein N7532_009944 [Penicillium argentinense]|uniref:Endo-arabinase n=1 Tax=Penicillium argentinense TaxID=1131581 RepID=A0A9W9ENM6_9EURO|nr:uncharacterized protein N7532_009944 [Penicillium argentinense]KAJ5085173.1 hypothetical protein N7532_009944 [Penicillium argentinense]